MQKYWYIIYTKPKREKKVSASLTRKKIENFYPVSYKNTGGIRKGKITQEPLFASYVFAQLKQDEIPMLLKLGNVVNFVYWQDNLVRIKDEEIETLRKFTTHYHDIRLERISVNTTAEAEVFDNPSYFFNGNALLIKSNCVRVDFPSLGYAMTVNLKKEDVIGRRLFYSTNELSLQ